MRSEGEANVIFYFCFLGGVLKEGLYKGGVVYDGLNLLFHGCLSLGFGEEFDVINENFLVELWDLIGSEAVDELGLGGE